MTDQPRSFPFTVVAETNGRELAEAVARAIHDHDDILQFALELDEVVADYDFTLQLRDALSAALAAEDVAGAPPMPGHTLSVTSGLSGCRGECSCGDWAHVSHKAGPETVTRLWDAEHLTSLQLEVSQ